MNDLAPPASHKQQPANARMRGFICDKCVELDKRITHYQTLALRVMDPPTVEGINKLINEMQARKAALHREQQ